MGINFQLQYGLTRLYRVLSCRPRTKKVHILILTYVLDDFQNLFSFLVKCFF